MPPTAGGEPGFGAGLPARMRQDQVSKDALHDIIGGAEWAATGSNVVPLQFAIASGRAPR